MAQGVEGLSRRRSSGSPGAVRRSATGSASGGVSGTRRSPRSLDVGGQAGGQARGGSADQSANRLGPACGALHRVAVDGRQSAGRPTAREVEVLQLVAEGKSNGEIGAALFISTKTASVHVSNILAKLGVSTRGEAAAIAHRRGLVGAV